MVEWDSKVTLISEEKKAKFQLSHQKPVVHECYGTLEVFPLNFVHISLEVNWYYT